MYSNGLDGPAEIIVVQPGRILHVSVYLNILSFLEKQYKHTYVYTYDHYPYEHMYAHTIHMKTEPI
jgi:hypothetical protein